MIINRVWQMPNSKTFQIKPISELIHKYAYGKIIDPFASSGSTGNIILSAGTYYLKIAKYEYSGIGNNGVIKITPHITEVKNTSLSKENNSSVIIKKIKVLKAPKLKKYKRNTKKIIGTALKKSTIKIKIGKKKYTVKANIKGKFTIKLKSKLKKKSKIIVYATKKGYKRSKTVVYKVK